MAIQDTPDVLAAAAITTTTSEDGAATEKSYMSQTRMFRQSVDVSTAATSELHVRDDTVMAMWAWLFDNTKRRTPSPVQLGFGH